MAILITGGAGYIGSHTMVEFLNAGRELVVVDNFMNSKPEALESISVYFVVYDISLSTFAKRYRNTPCCLPLN